MKKTIYSTICVDDTFNEWTVLDRPVEDIGYSKKIWCRCSCGTEKAVEVRSLRRGSSKSCGCKQRLARESNREKNIGLKFGKLTTVSYGGKDHHYAYKCLCECGGTTYVKLGDLVSGKRTACSCRNLERARAKEEKMSSLVGQTFGQLTVTSVESYSNGTVNTVCECGTIG